MKAFLLVTALLVVILVLVGGLQAGKWNSAYSDRPDAATSIQTTQRNANSNAKSEASVKINTGISDSSAADPASSANEREQGLTGFTGVLVGAGGKKIQDATALPTATPTNNNASGGDSPTTPKRKEQKQSNSSGQTQTDEQRNTPQHDQEQKVCKTANCEKQATRSCRNCNASTAGQRRIGVLTMVTPGHRSYVDLWPHSYPNLQTYCHLHGYDLIVLGPTEAEFVVARGRHPVWAKITGLLQHLERYDWLLWVDADLLVMNLSQPIDGLLPLNPSTARTSTISSSVGERHALNQIDLVWTRDHNGFNAGVLLIRHSSWSLRFLRAVLLLPQSDILRPGFEEQSAMSVVLGRMGSAEKREHMIVHPQRKMNSFWASNGFNGGHSKKVTDSEAWQWQRRVNKGTWFPGDFIIHFANCKRNYAECRKQIKLAAGIAQQELQNYLGSGDGAEGSRPLSVVRSAANVSKWNNHTGWDDHNRWKPAPVPTDWIPVFLPWADFLNTRHRAEVMALLFR